MLARELKATLRKRREKTVDLGDGKSVIFRRPTEVEMPLLLVGEGDDRRWEIGIDQVRKCVTGWNGFTEADLLGSAIGSADPVAFDLELWDEVVSDNVAWTQKIGQAILDAVVAHINDKAELAKNSEPG